MKKSFKRLIASFLVVVMCICGLPLGKVGTKVSAESVTYKKGDIIEFGEYPQSKVTNGYVLQELNKLHPTWKSCGYFSSYTKGDWAKYADVVYMGKRYRAVMFKYVRPESTGSKLTSSTQKTMKRSVTASSSVIYNTNIVYWYEFKPLKWKILDPLSGYVICTSIIDAQPYNNYKYSRYNGYFDETMYYISENADDYCCKWSTSSIRNWLNNDFYNVAFCDAEKRQILSTKLDNSFSDIKYNSEPTIDKVFLPTSADIDNYKCYGNISDTMYADMQGYYYGYTSSAGGWRTVAGYLTRTPINSGGMAWHPSSDGNCWANGGNGGDTTSTKAGIRPAISIDFDGRTKEENNNEYLNEHMSFIDSNVAMSEIKTYGFNNLACVDKNKLTALNIWEVIGDIGELLTFNIGDLTINADYYEMYLADMLLSLNNIEITDKVEWKMADTYNKWYGKVMSLLKTSNEWEKGATPQTLEEIEKAFTKTDTPYEFSEGTKEFLEKIIKDISKKPTAEKLFTGVFEGLDNVSSIIDKISLGTDVVNLFTKSYKTYVTSKAFYDVNNEFFNICYKTADELDKTNAKYAEWFRSAVEDSYKELGTLDIIFDTVWEFYGNLNNIIFGQIYKDVVKRAVYPVVAKLLHCNPGTLSAVAFAYNTGYAIANAFFSHNKASEAYHIINYITPLECAMQTVVDSYANSLRKNNDLESAVKYDGAYRMLRETNMYLYDADYKYCSARKNHDEMKLATIYKNLWKSTMCHYSNGTQYDLFVIKCPVDIYIYDKDDNVVASVINEEITACDSKVTVMLSDSQKAIMYPSDNDYRVEVIAREIGEMEYTVCKVDGTTVTREISSYNVPLEEQQVFTVKLTADKDSDKSEYQLTTGEEKIPVDYDSKDSCNSEKHKFGEWIVVDGYQMRKCSNCLFVEKTELHETHNDLIEVYSIKPSCTEKGHSIFVCEYCSEEVEDGKDIAPLGHKMSDWKSVKTTCTTETEERTCTVCHDYTETRVEKISAHKYKILVVDPTCTNEGYTNYTCTVCGYVHVSDKKVATGHTDKNNDGKCDICGEKVEAYEPSNPTENCDCLCHKTGFLGFIYKIIRIFWQIFGINKTCACGINHY